MISGEFNERGELFFDMGLIAADSEIVSVIALLDTGWILDFRFWIRRLC
jgi:hypothetical protein